MWWEKYLYCQFAEKGRGPDVFDCWGFGQAVMRNERGIMLPGYEELYETTQDRDTLKRIIFEERQKTWVQVDKPEPFDFILLKMKNVPMHIGVVTKPGRMIHCAKDINTVHESYLSMRWANSIAGFFRYAG